MHVIQCTCIYSTNRSCVIPLGESKTIEVLPKETPVPLEPLDGQEEQGKNEESSEEKVIVEVIKKKKFPLGKAPGLRIRQDPSMTAASIGIINPGAEFIYTEEVWSDKKSCDCHMHIYTHHVHW